MYNKTSRASHVNFVNISMAEWKKDDGMTLLVGSDEA